MVTIAGGISGNRQVPLTSELRYSLKHKEDLIIYFQPATSVFSRTRVYYGMTKTNKTTTASFWSRAEAIAYAVSLASAGDTVAVLGKGHELGQEITGKTFDFDDRIILARAIEAKR